MTSLQIKFQYTKSSYLVLSLRFSVWGVLYPEQQCNLHMMGRQTILHIRDPKASATKHCNKDILLIIN